MSIHVAWEKRDWGSGRPTWRPAPSLLGKRRKRGRGPTKLALRRLSNRAAKRAIWAGGAITLY